MITLRDYQENGVEGIRDCYSKGIRSVLYQLCTGGGKSCIFTFVTKNASAKGKRVWIIVHRKELVRQVVKHLQNQGVPHGLIVSGDPEDPSHLVQVCSIQTLVRRLDGLRDPDLIIIDEAHHSLAASWATILKRYYRCKVLGVSATPMRVSGAGLGSHCGGFYDQLICGPSMRELTERGFISPIRYYAPPTGVDISRVHTVAGEFNSAELSDVMDTPKITGSAVEHYTRICPGKPAIAFCCSIKHGEHVRDEFKSAGYRAELIDGTMDDRIREDRISSLGDGRLHILTSIDVLGEGVDVPVVSTGILLRPTQSLVVDSQQKGRIVRPFPGKKEAVILDHVGNFRRHGMPLDDRVWTLNGAGPRVKKSTSVSIPIKQCPACYAVFSPAPVCPICGFVLPIQSREVQQVDGQLVELNPEEIAVRQQKQSEREAKERQHLENIARARGYQPRWVEHIMQARKAKKTQNPIGEEFTIKQMKGEEAVNV